MGSMETNYFPLTKNKQLEANPLLFLSSAYPMSYLSKHKTVSSWNLAGESSQGIV